MLTGRSGSDRARALLICDECGRAMREVTQGSVDDLAAAAIRTGWRVKSADAAGARWVCQTCDDEATRKPSGLGRRDATS